MQTAEWEIFERSLQYETVYTTVTEKTVCREVFVCSERTGASLYFRYSKCKDIINYGDSEMWRTRYYKNKKKDETANYEKVITVDMTRR